MASSFSGCTLIQIEARHTHGDRVHTFSFLSHHEHLDSCTLKQQFTKWFCNWRSFCVRSLHLPHPPLFSVINRWDGLSVMIASSPEPSRSHRSVSPNTSPAASVHEVVSYDDRIYFLEPTAMSLDCLNASGTPPQRLPLPHRNCLTSCESPLQSYAAPLTP